MKFSSDELMPFSEVRTHMSHFLVNVQASKEIIITRRGKPIAAIVAATQLYRYRELARMMCELTTALKLHAQASKSDQSQSSLIGLIQQVEQLLVKPVGNNP